MEKKTLQWRISINVLSPLCLSLGMAGLNRVSSHRQSQLLEDKGDAARSLVPSDHLPPGCGDTFTGKLQAWPSERCPQLPSPSHSSPAQGSTCPAHGKEVAFILPRDEEIQSKYSPFTLLHPGRSHFPGQRYTRTSVHTSPWDCQGNLRNVRLRLENDRLLLRKPATCKS